MATDATEMRVGDMSSGISQDIPVYLEYDLLRMTC